MLPDSSKSLVSCCGYNMGMIKWTGNDLLTSKTIKNTFYQNPTERFLALIGQELWLIRLQAVKMMW